MQFAPIPAPAHAQEAVIYEEALHWVELLGS
jgi:hypothetical protein